MTTERHHLETIHQPDVHHEESDVNIRAIFGFAGGLAAVALVIHVVVWALFGYFDRRQIAASGPLSPLVTAEPRRPPEPRLQVAPREDLRQFRSEEDAVLNGYTWVNRDAGIVRIPIDEAIKLTLQNGLPVRANPTGGNQP